MMLWLVIACGTHDPLPSPGPSVDAPEEPPTASETEWGEVEEPGVDAPPTRALKRMSVAQARDSMERITGGIPWGTETSSNWDVFSETLGVADYQVRVESDLSPSVMFQKFLDDAAGATCQAWVETDEGTFFVGDDPESTDRTDVRAQVVHLRWQVQGRVRNAEDPIVDDYELLFSTVHQRTDSTEAAWATVCVAMFTHPDFYMY